MRKLSLKTRQLASSIISAPRKSANADVDVPNMMLDPRYLRQSEALIQEALASGFDVLQLATGEIVTTGTKTIVYRYEWDEAKGKLVKIKSEAKKSKDSVGADEDCCEDEDA